MAAHYQNTRSPEDPPPTYSSLPVNIGNPGEEDKNKTKEPIRKEIQIFDQRRSRNQLIKRYVYGFLLGFLFCLVIFLMSTAIWKTYEQSITESEKTDGVCQKRLIAYYNGWDNRKISEKQIEKLTHIIFDGVKLEADGNIEFGSDEQRLLLIDMKNKARVMKSNVTIMFSTDSYADNFEKLSPVMGESKSRIKLINSIAAFLLEQQLDGVELYYRWPESEEDKENYVLFVRELRYRLEDLEKLARRAQPFVIAVMTPPSNWAWEEETIIEELLKSVDFFNVETENFHGPWHKNAMTGPLSPLYSNTYNQSIDWTMKAYTCKTLEPSRFNFIIPFRGAYFKNVKYSFRSRDDLYRSVDKIDGEVIGKPAAWRYLNKFGFKLDNTSWHNETKTPYIWDSEERTLYTFDNERSLMEKLNYTISKNLGGIAVRRLEYDDDENTLFNAMTSVDLCSGPRFGKDEIKFECGHVRAGFMAVFFENRLPNQETPVEYFALTEGITPREPLVVLSSGSEINKDSRHISYKQSFKRYVIGFVVGFLLSVVLFMIIYSFLKQDACSQSKQDDDVSNCKKRIVGYFQGDRKITEEQIEKLTHIIFNGVKMQKDGKIDFGSDEKRLMFLDMKNKARNMKSDVQLLFATDSYTVNIEMVAPVMTESKMRKTWISSIASFLLEQQLDGVEIYYRWPITAEDEENFAFFIRELRYKLEKVKILAKRKIPFIICIRSPSQFWTSNDVPLLDDILNYVEFLNIETSSFYAPWYKGTIMASPISPLYSLSGDNKSVDWTMEAYTCKTMKSNQLNVMIPFRGALWENVNINVTRVDDLHFYVGGRNYSGTHVAWRDLKALGWNLIKASWNNASKTPYTWHPNNRSFITFENQRSLEEKIEYIISKNLGGATIDRIDEDDDSNTLLNAVTSVNMCSGPKFKRNEIKYDCGKTVTKQTAYFLNHSKSITFDIFLFICIFWLML
ncbi:unnamed protein product [Caenorhabditis brenneri]